DYSYRQRASIYQGIGAVYSSMGDLENSLENYNKALQIYERLNDLQGLGSCYARLGAVRVQQGEYDTAKPYFTSALRYLKESGNTPDVGFIHINLGYLYTQLGKNEQAAASLNQALQVADRTDNELMKALTSLYLGDIAFSGGDLSAALSRYEGAKDSLPALGLPLTTAKVYTKIGDVHRQQGDTKDAGEAYRQAIAFLEDSRERMQVGEFKLLWPKLGLETYHKYVRLLVEEGDDKTGLYFAERCKAKNLVDLMARGSTGVEDQGPLHIVRREEELYREISRLEDQLYEEWRKPGGKHRKSRIQDIKEVISYKKNQYTDLLTDMKLDAPQFLSLKSVQPQQLRFANQYLRGELSGDEVIVEYLVTDNETIAWIIGEEGITGTVRISLSREELVDLVTDYRETLTDSPPPESMMLDHLKGLKKAKGLYESLIEPIANYINGKKHLIIVPSDVLFYLPFEALYRCLSCEGEDLLGGHYLIEDYSISYAPSIASLYWPYQSQDNGGYRSILAVGNPTGDLSSAEEEAKEIASLFPTKDLLVKEEGTEESVKGLLSSRDYDVVHLSTHGVFDREVPLLSHLLFKESQQEDGVLYAREILATNLSSQLVVLSACQTALPSKLSPQTAALVMGDELQGLSQTLFVADVPSMILTLWNVDDRSTRVLMEEMYRNLEGGGSKAESLREAKLALLNGGSYYHPYFWSPFILYGVWR
ncbi:CHAT domain-containing protein, partial [Candidatus Bipolaricaulota bacterium]|nr:CHAT domain-containing protein [Candidatus Bipolaricaulota bacterium]